jgi:hypothetical protein
VNAYLRVNLNDNTGTPVARSRGKQGKKEKQSGQNFDPDDLVEGKHEVQKVSPKKEEENKMM